MFEKICSTTKCLFQSEGTHNTSWCDFNESGVTKHHRMSYGNIHNNPQVNSHRISNSKLPWQKFAGNKQDACAHHYSCLNHSLVLLTRRSLITTFATICLQTKNRCVMHLSIFNWRNSTQHLHDFPNPDFSADRQTLNTGCWSQNRWVDAFSEVHWTWFNHGQNPCIVGTSWFWWR